MSSSEDREKSISVFIENMHHRKNDLRSIAKEN